MAFPFPHRDEQAALAMDDLASALDAGLPLHQPGGDPASDQGPTAILTARGIRLEPMDQAILEAAQTAGELPAALRERAATRRLRGEMVRQLLGNLRYPSILIGMTVLVALVVGSFGGWGATPLLLAALGPGFLLAVILLVRVGLQGTSTRPLHLPLLGPILRDMGELPYLQTLRGLYAAGVPLLQANPQAIETVPVAAMRRELKRADALMQEGRPLAEALDDSQALSGETRQILATGEASGDLEGALQRAAIRRDQTLRSRAQHGVRVLAGTIYFLAVGVAVYVIFTFYTGYYGQLTGILGR